MKREDWKPQRRFENEYADVLLNMWNKFAKARVLSTPDFLVNYAKQAAVRMITMLYFHGAKTWREAAREAGKTGLIYRTLQTEMRGPVGERVRELVKQNSGLISSFPTSVARRVASAAAAQQQGGGRAKEFQGRLRGVVRSRAQLIARTEISKASTALTQARSEELDLPWYVWRTSKDGRVRESHKHMENVLVRFDTPPSPEALIGMRSTLGAYNAGNAPNDRCYPEPVVSPERLTWPHKAFVNGRIQYMTLSQFRLLNGERRLAA